MKALKKLKFWGKDAQEKTEVPQDIQDFQATRPLNGIQQGYVKDSAGVNAVAVAAGLVVVFAFGVLVYLVWELLFNT
jgi:hypothetical protein